MNADDDETPLPRDTAILVAAPMEDPLGPPERRPALAAMMRELASACGLVAPERTINRTDRVSWSTPRGAHPCYELSLTTYRMATGSAMSVDVRLLRGPDEPTRRSMRGEAVMRELGLRLVLRTRVPSTDDLRDHVPRDVLVMLAAFARAAAAALDGTAPLLTTTEWEDASGYPDNPADAGNPVTPSGGLALVRDAGTGGGFDTAGPVERSGPAAEPLDRTVRSLRNDRTLAFRSFATTAHDTHSCLRAIRSGRARVTWAPAVRKTLTSDGSRSEKFWPRRAIATAAA